jgi:hypothetical protein
MSREFEKACDIDPTLILKILLLPTWPLEKLLCKIQDNFAIELLLFPIVLFKC